MKAAVYTQYGPPEVVRIQELPKPIPQPHEVLIRVYAATVNRTDCGFRSAEYFISRFWSGLLKPKNLVLGCEFAGQIEAVGSKVRLYKPGDQVFGYNDKKMGGHAQYLSLPETETFTTLPAGFSYAQAAALTEGAHYALGHLQAANVQPGQNALVYGATGAIGSAAVQLLKHTGLRVTAICNTKNVERIRALGADCVVNYENEDFTQTKETFHFISDAVGKSSFGQCKPLLTPAGVYISTELGPRMENVWRPLLGLLSSGKKVMFPIPSFNQADLLYIKELAATGQFKPVIDRTFALEDIVAAYKYVETGQKTGNVLLSIP